MCTHLNSLSPNSKFKFMNFAAFVLNGLLTSVIYYLVLSLLYMSIDLMCIIFIN